MEPSESASPAIAAAPDPVEEADLGSFPASDPPPWWQGPPPSLETAAPRRTVIEFHGANCAWCLNDIFADIRRHGSVVSATLHAGTGCIEVRHDAHDLEGVLADIRTDLRGWRQADNGERVMIYVSVHPSRQCPFVSSRST